MLKDFFRRPALPKLVVDPQPGRSRLSLSLPEFATKGMPESVFLRRLIASYLPALKSFRSSQRTVPPARMHGRVCEIEEPVIEQNVLSSGRRLLKENTKPECESDYPRQPVIYGMRQISWRSNGNASSDAPNDLVSRERKDVFLMLILISIAAILVAVLFIRRSR